MSRRQLQQQQQQAANSYSERGLQKFSRVFEELNAKRRIIAAETGADSSLVRFRSTSRTGEWVPILPRPPQDLQLSSPESIVTPTLLEDAGNLTHMAADKLKSSGKSNWAAASKAHIVCFIRNKSWKRISKSSVAITIATAFFCSGRIVLVAIAAVAGFIWTWKHRQRQDSSSPRDHGEIVPKTTHNIDLPGSGFLQIATQSAPPSPKSSSKTYSLQNKTKIHKYRSQDLVASTSNTGQKVSDQRIRKRVTQVHNVKSQTPSPSSVAGGMESFSVLVLLSTILLGRIPAVVLTVFCFVILNLIFLRSKPEFKRMEETSAAVGSISSKIKATNAKEAFNKRAIIHADITSSEYRKKVIMEGLLERPNRR